MIDYSKVKERIAKDITLVTDLGQVCVDAIAQSIIDTEIKPLVEHFLNMIHQYEELVDRELSYTPREMLLEPDCFIAYKESIKTITSLGYVKEGVE